jgi:tRNA pseudouridine55 synthase
MAGPLNGLLVVDKPSGVTSHDVVACLRRATGEQSIGHLGTLDPMATGVLPLLFGKFTRLAQYFGELNKTYTGSIRFGFATDTYDAEGTPLSSAQKCCCSLEDVCREALAFRGEIEQMPPPFSAKKVGGVPAYKMARAGKEVVLKPKRITVHEFGILSLADGVAEFRLAVSSGGYVRSVAHELGARLGCGGHLASLRRVQAGPFPVEEARSLVDVVKLAEQGAIQGAMPHPRTLLPELPPVTTDEVSAGRLRNGMTVNLPEFSNVPLVKIFEGQHRLIAIGKRVAGTLFQPVAVIG